MKKSKPIAIHLDRLAAALAAQNVTLKRHQLLAVAAGAFGHVSANETSAASLAGELDPPSAQPIARVDLGGESVLIMRDMSTGLTYGMAESYLADVASNRLKHFATTPYGGLADLRRVAASDAPTTVERTMTTTNDAWTAVIQHGEGFHGHTWFREASARNLATEIAAWCVSHWIDAVGRDDTLPSKTVDLSDLEVIRGYFTAQEGVESLLMEDQETLDDVLAALRDGVIENVENGRDGEGRTCVGDGRYRAYPISAVPHGVPPEGEWHSSHDTLEDAIACCMARRKDVQDSAVVDHVARRYWRALRNWEPQDMPALAQSDDESVTTFHYDAETMGERELADDLARVARMIGEGYREGETRGGWWWRILGEPEITDEKCVRCGSGVLSNGLCSDETCGFSEYEQDDERGFEDHPEGLPHGWPFER